MSRSDAGTPAASSAGATAEWMNVPPGTWTADTIALKANSSTAYPKYGPKAASRRRCHAPTSANGTNTSTPTSTEKMNAAATNPPTRDRSSGPMPMPRRWSSVAGIVIEFHSPMARMNSTLPDAVDGDSDPNVASWRAYQGATHTANAATAPTAARNGIRADRG